MLQPVEQRVQIASCFERNQARCLWRKSLSSRAPTGQRSTTLPASGLSTGWPGKMSISAWLPRRITWSSPVWVISRVNRTHRVHMMHRSWLSWIRSETSLRGLTVRSSTNRWIAWPYS